MKSIIAPLVAVALSTSGLRSPPSARTRRTVLLNGKTVTLDAAMPTAEALAVRDGKIVAVGTSADIRAFAGTGAPASSTSGPHGHPRPDRLAHARDPRRACSMPPRSIGSAPPRSPRRWSASRRRRNARSPASGSSSPAAGPNSNSRKSGGRPRPSCSRPHLTTRSTSSCSTAAALLTPAGYKALNITSDADVPPSGKIERAADGTPTGWIIGDNPAISGLFDRLPLPTFDESVEGTRQFFRELNRLGITGVSDPGGFNLTAPSYQPLFKLWQDGALTVRVVYSLFAPAPRQRAGGLPDADADAADGLRRRLAALQRHRRERHLGHVQQRQPDRGAEGAALSSLQMGGVAPHDDHAALEQQPLGAPPARRAGARQPRNSDRAAALVDRASERRLAGEPRPHEGARASAG